MRPIVWGIILFLIGAVGWVFSVVFAVVTLGAFKFLTSVFWVLFMTSLPVAFVFELIRWIKKKKHPYKPEIVGMSSGVIKKM